jgi:gamma-glutamylcyclotransferase
MTWVGDMAQFLYFGYGSNMMTARLTRRCKSARHVGLAFADGYRLTFSKPSDDGSGKGHLVENGGASQPGVLFKIDMCERKTLDDFERVGNGYRREDSFVVRRPDTGDLIDAVTYLATHPDNSRRPYDWYLALIVTGAHEHRLSGETIDQLLATPYVHDPKPKRKWRLDAIDLLNAAGTDIESALRRPPT